MPTTQRQRAASTEDSPETDAPTVGEVDVNALIADLQATAARQQEHINALLAEKGIPADPIAAQILALQQHIAAQAGANPWNSDSYAALRAYVEKLDSESLNSNKALRTLNMVDSLRETHPGHELAYVRQLARDLHTMTLDPESDE
jgi:erythromycin esterase-like protein